MNHLPRPENQREPRMPTGDRTAGPVRIPADAQHYNLERAREPAVPDGSNPGHREHPVGVLPPDAVGVAHHKPTPQPGSAERGERGAPCAA